MAKKTITSVYDDIDGTEGAETVTFSFAGASYEIDLSDKNKKALEKALSPYIEAARSTSTRRTSSAASSSNKEELFAIRTWANHNGFKVSGKGRISGEIREAYAAAHK